jgi:hypothetical protein
MGILSLVLGIVGLAVFDWLGVTIGSGMVGAATMKAALSGNFEVSTGPIWGLGIGLGVAVPLIAVVAGILAIKANKRKGMGIAGLVLGLIAAIIGCVLTFGAAKAVDTAAQIGKTQIGDATNQLNSALSDPATQEALKKGLEDAMKNAK